MLVSAQVCAGSKVLSEWGVLAVNSDLTIGEVFHDWALDKPSLPMGSAVHNSTPIYQPAVA